MEDKRALKDKDMEKVTGGIRIPIPFLNLNVNFETKPDRDDADDKGTGTVFGIRFKR